MAYLCVVLAGIYFGDVLMRGQVRYSCKVLLKHIIVMALISLYILLSFNDRVNSASVWVPIVVTIFPLIVSFTFIGVFTISLVLKDVQKRKEEANAEKNRNA